MKAHYRWLLRNVTSKALKSRLHGNGSRCADMVFCRASREEAKVDVLWEETGMYPRGSVGGIEDGQITTARATMTLTFPDRFMFVAAMNP